MKAASSSSSTGERQRHAEPKRRQVEPGVISDGETDGSNPTRDEGQGIDVEGNADLLGQFPAQPPAGKPDRTRSSPATSSPESRVPPGKTQTPPKNPTVGPAHHQNLEPPRTWVTTRTVAAGTGSRWGR